MKLMEQGNMERFGWRILFEIEFQDLWKFATIPTLSTYKGLDAMESILDQTGLANENCSADRFGG